LQNKAIEGHANITSTQSSRNKENKRYVETAKPTAQTNVQEIIQKQEYSHCGVYLTDEKKNGKK
jgi:hypothetical protein